MSNIGAICPICQSEAFPVKKKKNATLFYNRRTLCEIPLEPQISIDNHSGANLGDGVKSGEILLIASLFALL